MPAKSEHPAHISLKVANDLEQDLAHFPIKARSDDLRGAAGEHYARIPKDAIEKADSRTVIPDESIRRDTVGAANPFALAAVQVSHRPKFSDPKAQAMVEKILGEDLETLTDPTKSQLIYPGLHVKPNQEIKVVQVSSGSGNTIDWVDDGTFFTDAVQFTDPIQGGLADCYFISALASTAWACPLLISQRPAPVGQTGTFADSTAADAISFFDSNGRHDMSTTETLAQTNGQWIYAHADDPKELWPGVYEKAFAKWHNNDAGQQPDMPRINYGDTVGAGVALTNGTGFYFPTSEVIEFFGIKFDLVSSDQIWQTVRGHSLGMRTFHPMMAWTPGSAPAGMDYGSAHVVLNHAYSILGWDYQNGVEYIVMRNPWGTYEPVLNVLSGDWWAYDVSFWRQTPLSSAGVFAIEAGTFKQFFEGFGVVVPPAGADAQ